MGSLSDSERSTVLLIEDDEDDYIVVRDLVKQLPEPMNLRWEATYETGLQTLVSGTFAVCLLDHHLGAKTGLDLLAAVPSTLSTPIILLTGADSRDVDVAASRAGAADYMNKAELTLAHLERSLRFARVRAQHVDRLAQYARRQEKNSLTDELTQLYNRRGFRRVGVAHLDIAQRQGQYRRLLFLDVDGLKRINDKYGHQEGDRAIAGAADILRSVFRSSDVLARIGGDEFIVLADFRADSEQVVIDRLQSAVDAYNDGSMSHRLSLSVGVTRFDPHHPHSLETLMDEADEELYRAKESRDRD